jgi:ABC-type Fe3+-hydroxamate transport system substrate-binding protein
MRTRTTAVRAVPSALAALVLLAACSSNGSSTETIPDESAKTAMSFIAPYVGKPNAFPITEPLASPVPQDAHGPVVVEFCPV